MEAHASPRVLSVASDAQARTRPREGPIRVLFLTIDITIGGAERLVLDLARGLDRRVFTPSVGWFSHEAAPREFEELGIPLFPIRKRPGFDWRAMRRLARIVAEERIDVINAHHFMSCVYAFHAARVAQRAGLVYTEHSEADVLSATGIWRAVGRGMLRSCDGVVGVSPRVSAALAAHFHLNPARVRTIENGVDLSLYRDEGRPRAEVRQSIGIGADDVVIGHVANFRRNKNHLFLVRAFHDAFRNRTDVKLLLVGQGFPGDAENSEPEVAAYVEAHGLQRTVRMLGYRPDVPDLLRAMDMFCLVSYKEGLPLSVIEAMARGLPIVATNIDGVRDVIGSDVGGALVEPDDVAGLVAQLQRLAASETERRRLGDALRQLAFRRYSFERCLEHSQQVLRACAPNPGLHRSRS
jgi:glycosyltransferase involved in cell wall biosynthesis